MKKYFIENYQLNELVENKLLINKYDLSVKYSYELTNEWEAFFFNILKEIQPIKIDKDIDLFNYFMGNYQYLIDTYNLHISKDDYIEISDYIPYSEWILNPTAAIESDENGFWITQE